MGNCFASFERRGVLCSNNARRHLLPRAFTLVELLAVICIIGILLAVTAFAVMRGNSGREIAAAAHSIGDLLDLARTHAVANHTYVWVGFFEEDGSQPPATPAVGGQGGRLVMLAAASQDGSRYDADNSNGAALDDATVSAENRVPLVPIGKIIRLDNIRLAAVNNGGGSGNDPPRPGVPEEYQLGEPPGSAPANDSGAFAHRYDGSANRATFSWPPGAADGQYVFAKIIEFNPLGEASKVGENVFSGPGPADLMEIAIKPARGGVIAGAYTGGHQNRAAAVLQIEGFTGQVRIFLP